MQFESKQHLKTFYLHICDAQKWLRNLKNLTGVLKGNMYSKWAFMDIKAALYGLWKILAYKVVAHYTTVLMAFF